eukprot:6212175-Pleurochrysis_carterae.AAC.2
MTAILARGGTNPGPAQSHSDEAFRPSAFPRTLDQLLDPNVQEAVPTSRHGVCDHTINILAIESVTFAHNKATTRRRVSILTRLMSIVTN